MEGGELIFEAKKSEGDYHSEMDSHNFEKWFDRILPKLEEHSIVVIDNAPYHSRRKEKIPTSANKNSELQAWLTQKQIPFEASEIKAQLMEKIKKEKPKRNITRSFQTTESLKFWEKTGLCRCKEFRGLLQKAFRETISQKNTIKKKKRLREA